MRVHQDRRLFSASEDGTIKVREETHLVIMKMRSPQQGNQIRRAAHCMIIVVDLTMQPRSPSACIASNMQRTKWSLLLT